MAEDRTTSGSPAGDRPPGKIRGELAQRIPVPIRTIIWAAGIFMLLCGVVAILAAFFVDRTQKQMIEVARQEVDRVARRSAERIEQIIAEESARTGRPIENLADIAFDPGVQATFRILSQDQNVLLSVMLDSNGQCIYYAGRGEDMLRKCPTAEQKMMEVTRPGNEYRGQIRPVDSSEPLNIDFKLHRLPPEVPEITIPIAPLGKEIGGIKYGIEEAAVLKTLEPLSRHISRSLAWMTGGIIGFCGLAIMLLCRIANRHTILQRQHADAQHLASIGTMASGLAHEIRNPLHAMNLHLESAREELEDPRGNSPDHAARTIQNVQRQIHSLNRTLTNFMNFALPNRLEQEPVLLRCLAGEVGTLLEPEFAARKVTFERDVPENAWIHADPSMVRQVLTNVLLNAAQALEETPGRREVRLTAVPETGRWSIRVDDTGPGIPAGKEEAIFEVFHSGRKGGTGFGLAIARRIMEAHRGAIHAATRPEGGARFTLVFPACKAPENFQEASAYAGGPVRGEPETIG